ncbi:MAG: ABC transporter substrate-binding protein [Pseudomonadota bacterium]
MLRVLLVAALVIGAAAAASAETVVKAAVIKVLRDEPLPISRLDLPPEDNGFAGSRLATADNNSTGRFLGQTYETLEATISPEEAAAKLDELAADGVRFVALIGAREDVLTLADHAAEKDLLILNIAARDDSLRQADCRGNVLHVAPSRAMIADGLAQYMVWKKWTEWFLIHGSHEDDAEKAEALRRSAAKFGAEIVEERVFEDTGGARRSDSGHVLVQRQIPVFTQDADDHHVVVVADQNQIFGLYMPYRNWDARPVVGDAGLIASMWHPAHESWGATQLQRRFEKAAGRRMTDVDYQTWLGLRVIGESVTRTGSNEVEAVKAYALSEDFEIAGFKGQALSFRPWNQQMRHGVILGDGKLVVTVSPQEEFLHQKTRLDTLGFDEPESECQLN